MTTKRQIGICKSQLWVKQTEKKSREGRVWLWDKRKGFLFSPVCDLNRCDWCVASEYVCVCVCVWEDSRDLPPRRSACMHTHTIYRAACSVEARSPFSCLLIAISTFSFLLNQTQHRAALIGGRFISVQQLKEVTHSWEVQHMHAHSRTYTHSKGLHYFHITA